MARKTKEAPGRATPKGRQAQARGGRATQAASGRYTAPIPSEYRSSPRWWPVLMLTLFGLGVLCILLNYLGLLPGAPNGSNWYLLGGLGLIVVGFIAATRYR